MEATKLGTSAVSTVPSLMNHENYSYELEEWLKEEDEFAKKPLRSKLFIGDRPYRHFDGRVSLKDTQTNKAEFLLNELRFPAHLVRHAFFPFIRKDKKVRRFTKEVVKNEQDEIEKKIVVKQKLRQIMYASHRDATIYGFYGHMLKKAYDLKASLLGIDKNVIAYRKIPRNDGSDRNKSNIDFANDIYKILGKHENSAIICLDITDFFGSMLHTKIEENWQRVLGVNSLPIGHKTVFKNITRYRYLFLDEVRVVLGLGEMVHGRFIYKDKLPQAQRVGPLTSDPKIYNQLVKKSNLIKTNGSPKGIPQGSPISDIIANMYLMEFDTKINNLVSSYDFGLSRRYSDDILIICPQDKIIETYRQIEQLLKSEGSKVNQSKSELFFLDRDTSTLTDKTGLLIEHYIKNKSTIQYLGFEFDLKDIHIRSGTIANHYRKLKRSMKQQDTEKDDKKPNGSNGSKKKRDKRDKYAYLKQASKRIAGSRLERQFINVRKRTAKLRRNS